MGKQPRRSPSPSRTRSKSPSRAVDKWYKMFYTKSGTTYYYLNVLETIPRTPTTVARHHGIKYRETKKPEGTPGSDDKCIPFVDNKNKNWFAYRTDPKKGIAENLVKEVNLVKVPPTFRGTRVNLLTMRQFDSPGRRLIERF